MRFGVEMRWKWTSGRKKAHVEFPCVWFIWIIKEEIFLFLLFLGFCFVFPSFPPPLTRGLWALGTASGKTDLKATTPCRSFHFLEEQLRLWVCEDTLAITLPPHIIICEIFSLSVSETSLTWNVVTPRPTVKYSSVWRRKLVQWLAPVPLQYETGRPLSLFLTGCKTQIWSYKQLV